MDSLIIGYFGLILFLTLVFLGVDIAISFLIVAFGGSIMIIGFNSSLSFLGQTLLYSISSPSYTALPLFVLMGAFAAKSTFAERAYKGINTLMRKLPGSLAIATSFGCAAFGAISGSSMATVIIFGKLALPEMIKNNYKKSFALGCIAASGTFAAMIPPSSMFIVYAIFYRSINW